MIMMLWHNDEDDFIKFIIFVILKHNNAPFE